VPGILLFLSSELRGVSAGTIGSALSGGGPDAVDRLLYLAKFLALNFPSPALLLLAIGLVLAVRGIRQAPLGFLGTAAVLSMAMPTALRWHPDQHVFLIPSFLFLALLVGPAADRLLAFRRRALVLVALLCLVLPPLVYGGLTAWLTRPDAPDPLRVRRPYYRTLLFPPRAGYDVPRRTAEAVLADLPPGVRVICTWGEGHSIRYLQRVEGARPDVRVVVAITSSTVRRQVELCPEGLFVTTFPDFRESVTTSSIPEGYRLVRRGSVYEVVRE
jgi:hypothetical protein